MAKSVSTTVLSNIQEIRPDSMPFSFGSAALGDCLLGDRQWRRPGWPAVRIGRSVHRRAFWGLAIFFDHSSGFDRYADHRSNTAKCRARQNRRTVHYGDIQSTVSGIFVEFPWKNILDVRFLPNIWLFPVEMKKVSEVSAKIARCQRRSLQFSGIDIKIFQ